MLLRGQSPCCGRWIGMLHDVTGLAGMMQGELMGYMDHVMAFKGYEAPSRFGPVGVAWEDIAQIMEDARIRRCHWGNEGKLRKQMHAQARRYVMNNRYSQSPPKVPMDDRELCCIRVHQHWLHYELSTMQDSSPRTISWQIPNAISLQRSLSSSVPIQRSRPVVRTPTQQ